MVSCEGYYQLEVGGVVGVEMGCDDYEGTCSG